MRQSGLLAAAARHNQPVRRVDYLWPVLLADSFLERNGTVVQVLAAVLVGIVVLAIERYWHYRDKSTKTLDFRVISDVPLFPDSNRPSDLKVTYFNNEVHDPRIVRVR